MVWGQGRGRKRMFCKGVRERKTAENGRISRTDSDDEYEMFEPTLDVSK